MELMGGGIEKIEIANKYLGAATMKIHEGDTMSFYLGGIESTEDVLKPNPVPWNFTCVVRDNIDNIFPNGVRAIDYLQPLSRLEYTTAFAITLKNGIKFVANGKLKEEISTDQRNHNVTFSAVGGQ